MTEYWVLDPVIDQVQAFRLEGGRYARAAEPTAEHGDAITTPLMPGPSVPPAEVFA